MVKKTASLVFFVFLASSVVLANNPFEEDEVISTKSVSNTSITSSDLNITGEDNIKDSSSSSQTQSQSFQYTIVKGDCLFKIARRLMGDESRWIELVELNKDRYPSLLSNPDMIEVGWVLTIPGSSSSGTQVSSNSTNSTNSSSNTSVSNSGNSSNSNTTANNSSNTSNNNTSSTLGNTQAKDFYELGSRAYNEYLPYTEDSARGEWIRKVGEIVKNTNTYGMKKSLIIAQIINESGWMKPSKLHDFNNVLGINTDMGRIKPSMQSSTWSKKQTAGYNNVTQWDSNGKIIGTYESMRHYDSIEECIEDYANVLSLYHPECVGNNNIEAYRSFLEGYTPNPNESTTDRYKRIIAKYNLERFDE